jgi:hypothetical protein
VSRNRRGSFRRSIRFMQAYCIVSSVLLLIAVAAGFRQQPNGVLRVRGIIVEDSQGRERILIGAPIPYAANRVRTDTSRVRALWSRRFPDPDQYMRYYAGYRHSMNGMIVLDERGIDRVAVGDSVPDPNVGKRIAPSTGIAINDSAGFERTGYGYLSTRPARVVLGLDGNDGREGAGFIVDDGGAAGSFATRGDRMLFLGSQAARGAAADSFGLVIRAQGKAKTSISDQR